MGSEEEEAKCVGDTDGLTLRRAPRKKKIRMRRRRRRRWRRRWLCLEGRQE